MYGLRALVPWSVGVAILLLTVGFAADTPHLWTSRPIVFVDVAVAAIVCRFLWGALGHGGRAVVLRSILGTGVFFAYLTVRRFLLPVPHSGSFWWDTPADALGALMVSAAATIVCAVVAAVIFFAVRGCVRLVDLQFFGHAMIDGRLSVSAAFARSSSIAQQARRDLFLFDLLFLGASAIAGALPVGFAAIAGGQHPSDTAASVVKEFVLLAGWLIVWPFLIAHAFIYRKLADA